jgi:carboxylesterase
LYAGSLFLSEVGRASLDESDKWQGYPGLPLKGALQLLKLQDAMRPRLPQVGQPVLIFQGRKDTTVHPSAGKLILEGVRSTVREHHWMERSSHAITLDCELDTVTDLTLRFMDGILKPRKKSA